MMSIHNRTKEDIMARPTNNFFKLEMILLKILDKKDCYGYQITQILDKITEGKMNIKEGTMYPILYRLMDGGYITDKRVLIGKRLTRVYYHLEPKGKEYLEELYEEYLQTIKTLDMIMLWEGEEDE